jgi:hypothetical protein
MDGAGLALDGIGQCGKETNQLGNVGRTAGDVEPFAAFVSVA